MNIGNTRMRASLPIILAVFFFLDGFSQEQLAENQYLVYLKNKNSIEFSLDQPENFLTDRAINRRTRQGISIDSTDLPVNYTYLKTIGSTGAEIIHVSKWLNAVAIQANQEQLQAVLKLEFVSDQIISPKQELNDRVYVIQDGIKPKDTFTLFDSLYYGEAWNQNQMLGIDLLHQDGYRGEDKWVGVFDSGFLNANKLTHFDSLFENDQIVWTQDMVNRGGNVFNTGSHGTFVLSTMASNKRGSMVGTAPKSSYLLFRTEKGSSETRMEEVNWLIAAEIADSLGVDIINTSLSYTTFDNGIGDYSQEDMDGRTSIISRASSMAHRKGILCISSAGNSGTSSTWSIVGAPADTDSILTVGGVDAFEERWEKSSHGPSSDGRTKPDVMAKASRTTVVAINDNPVQGSGTSFSGPIVAGFAASLWSSMPNLNNYKIREIIMESGKHAQNPDTLYGFGIPQYQVIREAYLNLEPNEFVRIFPNPIFRDDALRMEFSSSLEGQKIEINIYDPIGRSVAYREFILQDNFLILENFSSGLQGGLFILKISSTLGDQTEKLVFN